MASKISIIKKASQNKDILNSFEDLLGTGENKTNLSVAHPKYNNFQVHCSRFIKLLKMFSNSTIIQKNENDKINLEKYIIFLEKNFNETFTAPDLEQFFTRETETLLGHNYNMVPNHIKEEFSSIFYKVKKCNLVNIIIVTCNNLNNVSKYIENKENLSDIFLTKTSGNIFEPLPDSKINIKKLYNDDSNSDQEKQFILIFISKLYEISYNLYQTVSSPDINIEEFVYIVVTSIDEIKKHVPRCDEAISKIKESVELLRSNFSDYYKDFVASNSNPSIIMENFILDVSKNTNATPKLTNQFRKIISYYKNMSSKIKCTDSKLSKLFNQIDINFDKLDKRQVDEDTYKEDEVDEIDDDDEEEEIVNN